jgi:Tol biopolymer transport system component
VGESRQIAFLTDRDGSDEVFMMNADEGDLV